MKRRQLFEFNDATWLPPFLRALVTDYLQTLIEILQPFSPQLPLITQALRRAGNNAGVVDLCAGSGGPWRHLSPQLNRLAGRDVPVLLTDKYPRSLSAERFRPGKGIRYYGASVDATDVPAELTGMRTLFDGFHHFAPDVATAILRDVVRTRQPVVIMELLRRNPWDLLAMFFSPLLVWLLTPWIRPFSWRRLLLTYAIPVAPLLIMSDTLVSILRCYTPQELTAMGHAAAGDSYQWFSGCYRYRSAPVTFLVGYPRDPSPPGMPA